MRIETDKRIEDILADQGKLNPGMVAKLKVEAINSGRSVEDLITSQKLVDEETLVKAKSELMNIPFVDLRDRTITGDILSTIPETISRRYVLIPFELNKEEKILSVAMSDPLDLQILEFLERKTQFKIKPYISVTSYINDAINQQYSQSLTTEVSEALKETSGFVEGEDSLHNLEEAEELIRQAPVAKIVSTLLEYALKGNASDIHIEPMEEKTRVRFRIDGILQERLVVPKRVHEQLVTRVKILSDMKIDEKRVPQDGRFSYKLKGLVVDLRVSSLPTVYGEKLVMRILPKSGVVPTFSDLGMRGSSLKTFEQEILRPHGIILITGPTGSGKTTTLFAILSKLNTPRVNIVTVEDPVEYQIPGVNQVQINPQAGLTFASGLRSILRQDPNIIMVGEIRDRETSDLAIQASLTGHEVFSTLHTNSAAGALPRLQDMGAESYLLGSTVTCIVGQRVIRTICNSCKQAVEPSDVILNDIKKVLGPLLTCNEKGCKVDEKGTGSTDHEHKITLYKGKGCRECGNSGYSGRIGVFEVLAVNEEISRLILTRASDADIEKTAVKNGMVTLIQDGYLKALEGKTTIEEILRVAFE